MIVFHKTYFFHCFWHVGLTFALLGSSVAGQPPAPTAAAPATPPPAAAAAQDPAAKLATLQGAIERGKEVPASFELQQFPLTVTEVLRFKPMPVPGDWGSRTPEQRKTWMQAFPETAEGKAFLAEREALEKKRKQFAVRFEPDGSFVVYDVPPATYNVYGRQDLEADGKLFALEVYGQIQVGQVDEVKMPPLPLEVTRLLRAGETAPPFSVTHWSDGTPVQLTDFSGKPLLLYFWSGETAAATSDFPVLKAMYEALHAELGLELLAICADENRDAARKFLEENAAPWRLAASDGWSHAALRDYGVRSLPQYVLVDGLGKVRFSNDDFYEAFDQPDFDLTQAVRKALANTGDTSPTKQ